MLDWASPRKEPDWSPSNLTRTGRYRGGGPPPLHISLFERAAPELVNQVWWHHCHALSLDMSIFSARILSQYRKLFVFARRHAPYLRCPSNGKCIPLFTFRASTSYPLTPSKSVLCHLPEESRPELQGRPGKETLVSDPWSSYTHLKRILSHNG
jgi:hypothetical protein